MTLSKREKTMLYLLGCFLLAAIGIYLFILPAMATHATLTDQLRVLEQQQMERVQAITRIGTLDTHVKTLKQEMERTVARYAPPMHSEALDRQFTSMLRRHNGEPLSFVIEPAAEIPAPHYGVVAEADTLTVDEVPPLKDYMAEVDTGIQNPTAPTPAPETTTVDKEVPTVQATLLTVEAILKPEDANAFLAELSADPAVLMQTLEVAAVVGTTDELGNLLVTDKVMMTARFAYLLAPDLAQILGTDSGGLIFS